MLNAAPLIQAGYLMNATVNITVILSCGPLVE